MSRARRGEISFGFGGEEKGIPATDEQMGKIEKFDDLKEQREFVEEILKKEDGFIPDESGYDEPNAKEKTLKGISWRNTAAKLLVATSVLVFAHGCGKSSSEVEKGKDQVGKVSSLKESREGSEKVKESDLVEMRVRDTRKETVDVFIDTASASKDTVKRVQWQYRESNFKQYDADGKEKNTDRPSLHQVTQYDKKGNIVKEETTYWGDSSMPDDKQTKTFKRDVQGRLVEYAFMDDRNVDNVAESTTIIKYEYNDDGSVVRTTETKYAPGYKLGEYDKEPGKKIEISKNAENRDGWVFGDWEEAK